MAKWIPWQACDKTLPRFRQDINKISMEGQTRVISIKAPHDGPHSSEAGAPCSEKGLSALRLLLIVLAAYGIVLLRYNQTIVTVHRTVFGCVLH